MTSAKKLARRLDDIELILAERPIPGQLDVVRGVPVANSGGRPPGLYHVGPPGSTAGVLVYDPAEGSPKLSLDERTEGALFICCDPASYEPGVDCFDW